VPVDDDVITGTGRAQATEVAVASWPVRALGRWRVLVPGVSCAAAVALTSLGLQALTGTC
jgi:hypothetical protein